MHVHAVNIPSGPQIISTAAPETPNHVHTFVTQVGTAERIHVSSHPQERNGSHVHRVSLPLPLLRQNWRVLTTGPAISSQAKGGVGIPFTASAEPVWERFPRIRPVVAPGFMGLNVGPLQIRFGLGQDGNAAVPEGEVTESPSIAGSIGVVLPVLVGLGLLATAWYLSEA